jgi:hypothetical protein
VSHGRLAIYILKYLEAKEKLWKLKYFTMKKYNLQKNPPKETKINPSRYYNSINYSQVSTTQAKISSFKKPHKKKINLLPRSQNPLIATILYKESKHNILALVGKANKSVPTCSICDHLQK